MALPVHQSDRRSNDVYVSIGNQSFLPIELAWEAARSIKMSIRPFTRRANSCPIVAGCVMSISNIGMCHNAVQLEYGHASHTVFVWRHSTVD